MPRSRWWPNPGIVGESTILALVLGVAAGTIFLLDFEREFAAEMKVRAEHETVILEAGRVRHEAAVTAAAADVRLLAASQTMQRWLNRPDADARDHLVEEFRSFLTKSRIYDQVRVIAPTGMETIRVDYAGGEPRPVPDARLQDQSGRDYFRRGIRLERGQTGFSNLGLNVENGAVEVPHKPVIRIAAPLIDAAGRKHGILVVNYLGRTLLDRIDELDALAYGDLWLINLDGHWLRGDADEAWAFMSANRRDRRFDVDYPRAWQAMRETSFSGKANVDGDIFIYRAVNPLGSGERPGESGVTPENLGAQPLVLISRMPAGMLEALRRDLLASMSFLLVLLAMLVAGVTGFYAFFRASSRRAARERKAREEESQFRGLIEALPDPVIVIDASGRMVFVNAAIERVFGYAASELIGEFVEILVPQKFRDRHREFRDGYIARPRNRPMGMGLDLSGVRADGSEIPVDVSLGYAESGRGRLVIATIRDMTDARERSELIERYSHQLARDNLALASVNKELEAFSYSVSHDLRAPLRAIDGFSQALLEDYADKLDETGRSYAMRVRNGAQRMGMLIDGLLTLSRLSRGDLVREDVDLVALAREIVDELRDGDPGRDVEFECGECTAVSCDPRLVRIALENLLNNAWKFSSGRSPAKIGFGQTEKDGRPVFFVRDNGAGFDMRYADKLFGAFQRLHDARQFPGTGIGLATVQRVVNRHGGRIWAESEIGCGTVFYFTLTEGDWS